MEVYRSKYVVRTFDSDTKMLSSVWLATTDHMSDEDFKTEMLSLVDSVTKNEAILLLTNTKDMLFPINPELQQWGAQVITPLLVKTSLKKQAIIMPEHIIAQLGMDQTVDDIEKKEQHHKIRMFASIEDAKKWLLK